MQQVLANVAVKSCGSTLEQNVMSNAIDSVDTDTLFNFFSAGKKKYR